MFARRCLVYRGRSVRMKRCNRAPVSIHRVRANGTQALFRALSSILGEHIEAEAWDHLLDALRDLERGHVLIHELDGLSTSSRDWPTYLHVLAEAVAYWSDLQPLSDRPADAGDRLAVVIEGDFDTVRRMGVDAGRFSGVPVGRVSLDAWDDALASRIERATSFRAGLVVVDCPATWRPDDEVWDRIEEVRRQAPVRVVTGTRSSAAPVYGVFVAL